MVNDSFLFKRIYLVYDWPQNYHLDGQYRIFGRSTVSFLFSNLNIIILIFSYCLVTAFATETYVMLLPAFILASGLGGMIAFKVSSSLIPDIY